MEQSTSPCGCNEPEEIPISPKTYVNFRLAFPGLVELPELLKIIALLPQHELTGFEISKW